jgi:hypothetical protein
MSNSDFTQTVPPEPNEELANQATVTPEPEVPAAPVIGDPFEENDEGGEDEDQGNEGDDYDQNDDDPEDEEDDDSDEAEDDDFFAEAQSYLPDGAKVVTLIDKVGHAFYCPVPEGEARTMRELLNSRNLTVGADLEMWLNNAQITMDTLVPSGSSVTLIGSVKGG